MIFAIFLVLYLHINASSIFFLHMNNKIEHFLAFNFFTPCHFHVDCKIALVKVNGENPVKLRCMVLEKSAWKSVYRISDFTVVRSITRLQLVMPYSHSVIGIKSRIQPKKR